MTATAEREFQDTALMIARGKYSTLGAEKRAHLRGLRDDCETLADLARIILRAAQEPTERTTWAQDEMQMAEERLRAAKIRLGELARLDPLMAELKPKAWGKKGTDDE